MSLYDISFISACSEYLPMAFILIRLSRVSNKYLPLAALIAIGSINETISILRCRFGFTSAVNGNIYVLLELFAIIWLFYQMQVLLSKKFLISIAIIGLVVWITDNLVLHSLSSNNSLFRMVASFLVIYLSIEKICQKLFAAEQRQPNFTDTLLSAGFLTYFLYKAFIEAFHVFPMHLDKSIYKIMWLILAVINFIVNILFAIAILCIQRKNPFYIHLSRG